MSCPKVAIFDLDNTLAEPFQPVSEAVAASFGKLMALVPVSIMSAASLERIQENVLPYLPADADLKRLRLFTANAGQSFTFDGTAWKPLYHFEFSQEELTKIHTAISDALRETNALENTQIYGEQFIDYKGYFAFTALGTGAPVSERRAWDPDHSKRDTLRAAVAQKLPEFDVYVGGSTSIDVTLKGISKAYGITWLSKELGIAPSDMLYVGDALYEGGNDHVVIATGIQTRQVKAPEDTLVVINELLKACAT